MPELQTIPARHGVATFVPAGQVIKIINKTGTQVVDTWAFALPKPEEKKEADKKPEKEEKKDEKKDEKPEKEEQPEKKEEEKPKETPKKSKKGANDLPSQEEAEKATREGIAAEGKDGSKETPKKAGWSSYVPSVPTWSSKKAGGGEKAQTQQQKDSKTWSSYFPSGQGFSNYIPKSAGQTVSSFSTLHKRDPNKSYIEQLTDFSKTPVGAAGMSGMAAFTGSGYGGVAYAGYKAYSSMQQDAPPMEFMSMAHTRAATLHMIPRVNDTLFSNLREPILTIVEDSGAGVHDTLIPACDPMRYKGLGVEKWEEHGSCAENLVLALKELNERAGLKGAKGVGADVTINSVPAPLNLFMNIPWTDNGDISFEGPKSSEGDFVRLKAERDVVVVMSACPNDVNGINGKEITDASFVVEDSEDAATALKRQQPKKRPTPRKLGSSQRPGPPSTVATGDLGDDDKSRVGSSPAKKPVPKRAPVKKQPPAAGNTSQAKAGATPAPKKKPAPAKPAAAAAKPAEAKKTAEPSKAEGETNGTATPPAEKKKPRKLNKPAAAAE